MKSISRLYRRVRNRVSIIIGWYPIIMKDEDYDYEYILRVIRHKLTRHIRYIEKYGHTESGEEDKKYMKACIDLIDLMEESYITHMEVHDKAKDLLFKVLNDKILEWWD